MVAHHPRRQAGVARTSGRTTAVLQLVPAASTEQGVHRTAAVQGLADGLEEGLSRLDGLLFRGRRRHPAEYETDGKEQEAEHERKQGARVPGRACRPRPGPGPFSVDALLDVGRDASSPRSAGAAHAGEPPAASATARRRRARSISQVATIAPSYRRTMGTAMKSMLTGSTVGVTTAATAKFPTIA